MCLPRPEGQQDIHHLDYSGCNQVTPVDPPLPLYWSLFFPKTVPTTGCQGLQDYTHLHTTGSSNIPFLPPNRIGLHNASVTFLQMLPRQQPAGSPQKPYVGPSVLIKASNDVCVGHLSPTHIIPRTVMLKGKKPKQKQIQKLQTVIVITQTLQKSRKEN